MVATHAKYDEPMSEAEYRRFALSDGQGQWELVNGRLRGKPPMSIGHRHYMSSLGYLLQQQLDPAEFRVGFSHTRLRTPTGRYFVPDLVVVPVGYDTALGRDEESLDAFLEPMPLVVEIWSPSTGDYDVDAKLPEYRKRSDLEIWRRHPRERTLTTWVQQPDGGYVETSYAGGVVRLAFLPGIAIDLETLFV